ncbi:MAG: amidohydrolase [Flavobacteriales bacterium]|nr:amidohydrolase [Flavobacteriales bacterium]MBP6698069.1 amidohydrolase [Flavobacteriales bacterium]
MRDLKVTLVQTMLHWEDAPANRGMFAEKLVALKGTTDLIVLPEMFTTGFSMRSAEMAETMDGATVDWMRAQARTMDAALYGSVIIKDEGKHLNRGLFVEPSGKVTVYDKRHLFRFASENDHYAPGTKRVVVEWRGWRLLLQVCFDLRFPVFARNRGDYDAMLYVANWPEARRYPWSQLLIARALENQCYVVGENRVGMDGKGIHYSGDSVVIDPRGAVIGQVEPSQEGISTSVLDGGALEDFREKFPVGKDADDFSLSL